MSFYGCASRYGQLQVFLLLVFVALYCNTCAHRHGYMYVIFDILFYMLSVCLDRAVPVLIYCHGRIGVEDSAGTTLEVTRVQMSILHLLVPYCCSQEVGGDPQCLDLIRRSHTFGQVEKADETPEIVPDKNREDNSGLDAEQS